MSWNELVQAFNSATPSARLQAHREFWGDSPPSEIAARLDIVEGMLAEGNGRADAEARLILSELDHRRTAVDWATDPDTIRGVKQAAGDRKGGERSAAEKKALKAAKAQEAATRFDRMTHIPERNRAAIIAEAMGCNARTVREYLRMTGRKADG